MNPTTHLEERIKNYNRKGPIGPTHDSNYYGVQCN